MFDKLNYNADSKYALTEKIVENLALFCLLQKAAKVFHSKYLQE